MKSKASSIPGPTAERKVSAIVGRGARAKNRKRTHTPPAVVALPVLHQPDDEEEILDELPRKRTAVKRGAQVKGARADQVQDPGKADKYTALQSSRPRKAPDNENAWVSFLSAGDDPANDTDPAGSSPQTVKASDSDSVQPPPKVSPNRRSRKRQTHSMIPSDLEESISHPKSTEESTDESQWSVRCQIIHAQFQKILTKHPRILATAAVLTLFLTGFVFGNLRSGPSVEEEKRILAKPNSQLVKELNEALSLIESGEAPKALQKIQTLSAKHPDVSSLDYLTALAALQAGDIKTAQEKASVSITKNEKVSDSLVLLSMTESGAGAGGKSSLRDPKIVRESLLRDAVDADVSNPFPMIELASYLRSQKRDDEALDLLRAANARLHPIDTHVVVQTSIQLMKLQQTPDEELPAACSEGSITEIFASVYISLRKKDYNQASLVLEKGRRQASPDLFAYLINDPVFKPFREEPVMTRAL